MTVHRKLVVNTTDFCRHSLIVPETDHVRKSAFRRDIMTFIRTAVLPVLPYPYML